MTQSSSVAPLTKADYELLAEFRYRLRRFLGFSEKEARKHGISPQQYQALLAIEGYPGRNRVTIGELAEQMCVTHHSMVGMLNRMEAQDLVQRSAGEEDKRQVWITLKPKGLHILEQLYRVHRTALQYAGPHMARLLREVSHESEPTKGSQSTAVYSSPACMASELRHIET
jgi:DNA-binding MarR family transcriptional regulator